MEPIADWVTRKMYKNMGTASMAKLIEKAGAYGDETSTEMMEGDDELYQYFHSIMINTSKKMME
jgi:hypothetical protein